MNHNKTENKHPHRGTLLATALLLTTIFIAILEYHNRENTTPYKITVILVAVTPILLKKHQINKLSFAITYFTTTTLLFTMPILHDFDYLGYHDWDFHTAMNAITMKTILNYKQIPQWNPYIGGGKILIANPSSGFLSPFYAIILAFGTIHGIKIQIIVHTFIGLIGFYLLSRHLGLRDRAAYLPSLIYMFSSFYPLHLTVGHYGWIATCWLPYAYLYYHMSYRELKFTLPAGLFTALIYLEAHGYLFIYTFMLLGFHAFFTLITNFLAERDMPLKTKIKPITVITMIVVTTFIIGAVKMLPTYIHTRTNPHIFQRQPGFTVETLKDALINPDRIDTSVYWHNKSAYIGVIPILLVVLGAASRGRKAIPILLTLFIIVWTSFTTNASVNLWEMIHRLPVYESFRAPTRLIMIMIFITAILAGYGLKKIEKISEKLATILLAYITLYLITVNSQVFHQAFIIEPYTIERAGTEFQQGLFKDRKRGEHSNAYTHFLANQGYLNDPEPVRTKNHAEAYTSKKYRGEAYVLPRGKAGIISFTPNKVVVEAKNTGKLVLNQNYAEGWKADNKKTISVNGLIGTEAEKGDTVTFTYTAPGLLAGAVLTTAGLMLTALALTNNLPHMKKKRTFIKEDRLPATDQPTP
jgi:hypothetical protein